MELELKHRNETLTQQDDLVKQYIESLPNEGVFYDLGACVGTYALMACKKGMIVYAVEVDEVNFKALVENYEYNFGKGVFPEGHSLTVSNVGVADRKGKLNLRIGQPEVGGHHKTLDLDEFCGHPSAAEHSHIREVDIDTLDNLVEENKIHYPDYIKIDIDGSEWAFLEGAKKCLQHAKSLIIELYDQDPRFPAIIRVLNDHGFKQKERGIDLEPHLYDIIFTK